MFVDSHAHVSSTEFDADREEVLARARAAGIGFILDVGSGDPRSGCFDRAAALSDAEGAVYAAVGVHPHDAKLFDDSVEKTLVDLIRNREKVVALGEIGLDFHYDHSPREVQVEVFQRQLRLARQLDVPVIIHSRSANEETVELLQKEWDASHRSGIMHCFSGSLEMAKAVLELNFAISFSGNITFKNAGALRNVVRAVPIERTMIETDCPYLTPVPFRGKRNEPARVVEVARCLAEIHDMDVVIAGEVTAMNFKRVFDL